MSQKVELKLDWASHEAATYACENWHYSKCVPKSKQNKIGVWEDKKFIGVVMIGNSSGCTAFSFLGLDQFSAAELTRVALTTHKTPVSKIVSVALKLLKRKNPGLRAIVSFADSNVGHVGGIYQAGNWKYFGTSTPQKQWYFRGKWRNDMKLNEFFKGRNHLKDQLPTRLTQGKHKYVMFFDKELEKKFQSHFRPYPKRVASIENDVLSDQEREGGVNPTATLQLIIAGG